MVSRYFYRFRQTHPSPPGSWVSCGPFETYEQAVADRKRSKEWDCELSHVFASATKKDAEKVLAGWS